MWRDRCGRAGKATHGRERVLEVRFSTGTHKLQLDRQPAHDAAADGDAEPEALGGVACHPRRTRADQGQDLCCQAGVSCRGEGSQ